MLFFTKNIDLNKDDDYLILVNKNHSLDNNYTPNDLIEISIEYANKDKFLRKDAANSFMKLSKDAKELGYRIIAVSAFRNYEYQDTLYNNYILEYGFEYASICSARPGYSEHQTGLAVDVEGSNKDYDEFENSNEFNWMINNAYKYGYILRYPKGKEKITGYKYEPWHFRYVGKKVAKKIYNKGLTLEEYLKEKK